MQNLVVMTVRETRPGGIQVIASQSVSDSLGPPAPRGSVRARLVSGGGVILPAPDGGCDVMFMTQARGTRLAAASLLRVLCALTRTRSFSPRACQVDFGGYLPPNLVALVARTSPLALALARQILSGEAVPKCKK